MRADRPGRGDTAGLTLLPFAARRSAIDAGTGGRLVLRKAADGVAGRLGLFAAGLWSDFDEFAEAICEGPRSRSRAVNAGRWQRTVGAARQVAQVFVLVTAARRTGSVSGLAHEGRRLC